jgi:Domain of unknown function (DUF4838)
MRCVVGCLAKSNAWEDRLVLNRRKFAMVGLGASVGGSHGLPTFAAEPKGAFRRRGLVLTPEDTSLPNWPERARRAGLTTLALHEFSLMGILSFTISDAGLAFLDQCRAAKLEIEYELHLMSDLLQRSLFAQQPEWFRMNASGQRTADANCCVHLPAALDHIARNAAVIARLLPSTSDRYFFWGDDGASWCRCPKCKELSDSEQAVVVENRILKELRKNRPQATLAHLAYHRTLAAPRQVRPSEGLFLEFAPIDRAYGAIDDPSYKRAVGSGVFVPLKNREFRFRPQDYSNGQLLDFLDANLEVFPKETAQVLDYWTDVSVVSRKKPARKQPFDAAVMQADLIEYRKRGLTQITNFAVWVDAEYAKRHGDPTFIQDYGDLLRSP